MPIKLNRRCAIICGALLGLLVTFTANAGEGSKLLDKFLTQTHTMSAAFTQTLMAADGKVLQESTGHFYLQRPGRFRWNYDSPYEQQIVNDGEHIWVYDVDLEQVTVRKAEDKGSNKTPMALIENKATLEQAFEIHERGQAEGLQRVELLSKSDDGDFSRVLLGLDQSGLRTLQLLDQFEQTTNIIFSELKTNTPLDSKLFEFKPPEGVDVFGGN
jgi:outer membrane lipoprotein carrier protein